MKRYIKAWKESEYNMLPSFLAFYMLESIIPSFTIIILFTRILNVPDEVFLNIINSLLPNTSSKQILDFIKSNINQGISIVISVLSFHIIARGIKKLSYSINKLYDLPQLSFIYSYIKAYIFTFLFLISTSLSLCLIFLFTYKYDGELTSFIVYPILIVYLFLFLLVVFRFLPSIRLKYKNIYLGSLFISISISLLLSFLPILNNKFLRLDSIYGSISWIMILLFLLHLIAYIIYLGIIINSLYIKNDKIIYIHKNNSIF